MATLSLTDDQVVQLVKQLPLQIKHCFRTRPSLENLAVPWKTGYIGELFPR